jgi:hypothetical protein
MASNNFRRIALAQGLLPTPSVSLSGTTPTQPTAEGQRRVSEAQSRPAAREVGRELAPAEA